MFTGIIEEVGEVRRSERGARSARLTIACARVLEGTRLGESLAVDGVCLTAAALGDDWFAADVMPETMARSGLGRLAAGHRVNLERALRLGDRLGGHLVSGHLDGTGLISGRRAEGNAILLTIEAPPQIMAYVVSKGSIAVDGASLTVVREQAGGFEVSLVPHTARATTLADRREGDSVNLECDLLGKYVAKLLRGAAPREGLTERFLTAHGFAPGSEERP